MKKQKHFSTEQEILDAIDLAIDSRNKLRNQVDLDELEIIKLAKEDGTIIDGERICNHIAITNLRERAERFKTKASRIDSVRLPKLKNCLAAMRTETMPFVEDKSVVL